MANEDVRALYGAITDGDVKSARVLLQKHPELITTRPMSETWLHVAAARPNVEMVDMLLNIGIDVNVLNDVDETALAQAVADGQLEVAEFLIEKGANPNIGRPLIAAINQEDCPFEMVKLLVENGVDVNHVFLWFDDPEMPFNALSHAIASGNDEIVEYLKANGAVLPENSKKKEAASKKPKTRSEEVEAYFAEHFGPVYEKSLQEIVPTNPPISVHVIKPDEKRNYVTFFTTGMSARSMKTPRGSEDFQLAELFVQLPGDWPLTKKLLNDPQYSWSIEWLRKIAKYPHQNKTWLGGPVTIIADEEPPKPFIPKLKFTSMLFLAERKLTGSDGKIIQLYRMAPLYTEERERERSEGIAALMNAFDDAGVSFVVDLQRPNVALK